VARAAAGRSVRPYHGRPLKSKPPARPSTDGAQRPAHGRVQRAGTQCAVVAAAGPRLIREEWPSSKGGGGVWHCHRGKYLLSNRLCQGQPAPLHCQRLYSCTSPGCLLTHHDDPQPHSTDSQAHVGTKCIRYRHTPPHTHTHTGERPIASSQHPHTRASWHASPRTSNCISGRLNSTSSLPIASPALHCTRAASAGSPASVVALGSPPAAKSAHSTGQEPQAAAHHVGVTPWQLRRFGSAPRASRPRTCSSFTGT